MLVQLTLQQTRRHKKKEEKMTSMGIAELVRWLDGVKDCATLNESHLDQLIHLTEYFKLSRSSAETPASLCQALKRFLRVRKRPFDDNSQSTKKF